MISTVVSQQDGPGFDTRQGYCLSLWSLHVLTVSALVLTGYPIILPQSKDMQVRLPGDSKAMCTLLRLKDAAVLLRLSLVSSLTRRLSS